MQNPKPPKKEEDIHAEKKRFRKNIDFAGNKIIRIARHQRIRNQLERAGLSIEVKRLTKIIFTASVAITFLVAIGFLTHFSRTYGIGWGPIIVFFIWLWTIFFAFVFYLIWMSFYVFVDVRIYKRKVDIENVLPDYLQLTASNINAGMTIDRALWFAVRPRFGVLAKEIESIAKATMSGADLKVEMEKFANRFDSPVLKRSVSMLNESIDAGGKIGDLLNRIALDIQEQNSIVKEMSANITTYIIFIVFATIAAAPFLFGLAGILIDVVRQLGESVGSNIKAASNSGMALTFSGTGISKGDFVIFAVVSLSLTSIFSSMMISTIKKGNITYGLKYIPPFILVTLSLYFIVQTVGSKMLGLFF